MTGYSGHEYNPRLDVPVDPKGTLPIFYELVRQAGLPEDPIIFKPIPFPRVKPSPDFWKRLRERLDDQLE